MHENLLTLASFPYFAFKRDRPVGYKVSLDHGSISSANQKIAEGARAVKEIEYMDKKEIISISEQCKMEKVRNLAA